jgi:prolyl oligopeptidase PreP (S9A serine peptidase family)
MRADDVPIRIVIEADGSIKQTPITTPLDQPATVTERRTTSADGSRVNFLIVRKHNSSSNNRSSNNRSSNNRSSNNSSSSSSKKPAGLLVYGYGSYGIPTFPDKAYTDYKPLIDVGWTIAFAFIRGGGDLDDSWAAAGRLYNRQRSIEDFEAVIRAARVATGVPPERTVITGRSAGGLLVGTVAARNPTGQLFGGIYAEVPFLDVLKTMNNRKYPRTTTEQNEFGDPARSLTDFMVALEHSPVNRVACTGLPNIFVLARTAENDSQVLPYEPLKWIWRLREGTDVHKEGKLFAYAKGQGHFYVADAAETARSNDLAILHEWATNQAARKKIAVYSIKMANGNMKTRKNRTERKQRKQDGGKRKQRKSTGTRKAHRKGRKSTRSQRKH